METGLSKNDKWIMIFTLVDILFLPYFFAVTITYSFFFVIWWYYKRKNIIRRTENDNKLFGIMCIFMALSSLFGMVLYPDSTKNNIVFTLQFIVSFMHFYVFKYYFDRYSFQLKKYLLLFVTFALAIAVIFVVKIDLYYLLRTMWAPQQSVNDEEHMMGVIRYGFLWMDENNIAYIVNSIMLFILCNERSTLYEKMFVIVSALFINTCCMSRGGMLTFYTGLMLYGLLFFSGQTVKRKIRGKKTIINLFLLFVVAAGIVKFAPSFFHNEVYISSQERIEDRESDNRKQIYNYMLTHANFIEYSIIGHGAKIVIDGRNVKPHSLHFYWIFVYGFISYIMMLYIMFRKRRITKWSEYIWIWPCFFGCSINIIIGEEKAMCIALLLLAASSSKNYLIERRT